MEENNKKTYYLQQKWGNHTGWFEIGKYYKLDKAILKCENLKAKNRQPWNNKWYKSRVIVKDDKGNFDRVYPVKKENPRNKK